MKVKSREKDMMCLDLKYSKRPRRTFSFRQIDSSIRKLVYILLFCVCFGCRCDYEVDRKVIMAGCVIDHGLKISKITVDSLSADGIPVSFKPDTIVICSFRGNQGARNQSFTPERRIYLQKANESYDWFFFQPYEPGKRFKLFPLTFVRRSWYQLVSMASASKMELFIYVNDDGSLSEYDMFAPGPF